MAKDDIVIEEQTTQRGTPIIPDDDPEWGSGAVMVEPGLMSESGKQVREEEKVEDQEEQQEDNDEQEEDDINEPAQFTAEDPGEFQPQDYSFEVTTYDKDGNNPRTVKVTSVEQWDKMLGDDVNFGSAQALMVAERKASKMDSNAERDRVEWEKAKAKYDEEREAFENTEAQLDNFESEMNYLVGRGDMPKVPAKFTNDWTSAEAKKDPAIKEQQKLINYMNKENRARAKAGLQPETSLVSAYKAYKLDQMEKEEATSQRQAGQARREAGARVAGTSPAATTVTAPKGIAVGRAGSLNDLSANSW
jgi:hypothetical protein